MSALADRVARLTEAERSALAERLGLGATGPARLFAFAVPAGASAPDPAALRDWLAERVPKHMVPDEIVLTEAMPRLPNGKIDRRALMALPIEEKAFAVAQSAPTTRTETALAAIWSDLLGVEPILPGDNFFELGGDSIVAIQMVSRARQQGLALDPADIADHPTLAALATKASLEPAATQAVTPPASSAAFSETDMDAQELGDFLDALEDE